MSQQIPGAIVKDLKANKAAAADKKAGGLSKLRADIDAIASVQDCKKVLQRIIKVLVD